MRASLKPRRAAMTGKKNSALLSDAEIAIIEQFADELFDSIVVRAKQKMASDLRNGCVQNSVDAALLTFTAVEEDKHSQRHVSPPLNPVGIPLY